MPHTPCIFFTRYHWFCKFWGKIKTSKSIQNVCVRPSVPSWLNNNGKLTPVCLCLISSAFGWNPKSWNKNTGNLNSWRYDLVISAPMLTNVSTGSMHTSVEFATGQAQKKRERKIRSCWIQSEYRWKGPRGWSPFLLLCQSASVGLLD